MVILGIDDVGLVNELAVAALGIAEPSLRDKALGLVGRSSRANP